MNTVDETGPDRAPETRTAAQMTSPDGRSKEIEKGNDRSFTASACDKQLESPAPFDERQFWLVSRVLRISDRGLNCAGPRKRHFAIENARAEAQRLAAKAGEPFVVLGVIDVAMPVEAAERAVDTARKALA